MVPGHLVTHDWSPIDWSLWTNSSQPIQPPLKNDPQKFDPNVQMVPNQFGFPGQIVPRIFSLPRGTVCGDPEILGPNWLGTICLGGPKFWGPFFQGTICLEGSIKWGLFVQGDRKLGTGSPGIKYVWDQIRCSLLLIKTAIFCKT